MKAPPPLHDALREYFDTQPDLTLVNFHRRGRIGVVVTLAKGHNDVFTLSAVSTSAASRAQHEVDDELFGLLVGPQLRQWRRERSRCACGAQHRVGPNDYIG